MRLNKHICGACATLCVCGEGNLTRFFFFLERYIQKKTVFGYVLRKRCALHVRVNCDRKLFNSIFGLFSNKKNVCRLGAAAAAARTQHSENCSELNMKLLVKKESPPAG